jgi:hypothetical protein
MSGRLFSILRRKPGFIHLVTPLLDFQKTGVLKYRFYTDVDDDPNFTAPTPVITVSNTGFIDPAVAGPQNPIIPGNNVQLLLKTEMSLTPGLGHPPNNPPPISPPVDLSPYTYPLPESAHFWLKLVYVDSTGADMSPPPAIVTPSAPTLVLPPFVGNEQAGFNSTAPSGSDITDSLQIDLPRQMSNFRVRNLSTSVDLCIAFQEGGPEIIVPGQSSSQESIGFEGIVSSFWIRGSGNTCAFSCQFTYANPR